ncbi:hypothetical protein D3C71_617990 [compost metagenome]
MRLLDDSEKKVLIETHARLDELVSIYESQHAMTQEEYNDTQNEILSIRTLQNELAYLAVANIETLADCEEAYEKFVADLKSDDMETTPIQFTNVAFNSPDAYKIQIETIREFLTFKEYATEEIEEEINWYLTNER